MMKLVIVFASSWMMMMMVPCSSAFKPRLPRTNTRRSLLTLKAATKEQPGVVLDYDRVRECAESFSECSVDELKELKDQIITNRVQQFVLQGDVSGTDLRRLEEDIDTQIAMLEMHNNAAAAAAAAAATATSLDSLEKPVTVWPKNEKFADHRLEIPSKADLLAFEETLAEENLLEPIAMCFVVATLFFLPQLLS